MTRKKTIHGQALIPTVVLSQKQLCEEALASVRGMLHAIRRGDKALAERIAATQLQRAGWHE